MNHHFYSGMPPPALPNAHYSRRFQNPPLVPAIPHPHFSHPQHLPSHPHPHLQHHQPTQPHPLHHGASQPHISPSHQPLHPHLIPTNPLSPTHVSSSNQVPSTPHPQSQPQPSITISSTPPPTSPILPHNTAFTRPPLPWLSAPEQPFPPRKPRRRGKASEAAPHSPSSQPLSQSELAQPLSHQAPTFPQPTHLNTIPQEETHYLTAEKESNDPTVNKTVDKEIYNSTADERANGVVADKQPNDVAAEREITNVTPEKGTKDTLKATPSQASVSSTSAPPRIANPPPAVPLIPIAAVPVPSIPKTTPPKAPKEIVKNEPREIPRDFSMSNENTSKSLLEDAPVAPTLPPPAPAPAPAVKTFADLFKSSSPPKRAVTIPQPNSNGPTSFNKTTSLVEVLRNFNVTSISNMPLPVLKPRGLINTGNMCYMNAILQMLMFCGPFYSFLDLVGKQVAHNFKGDTPLIDAMVLFLREFQSLGAQALEKEYLEKFGEPFVPEFVYSALRQIQRFSSMRRGHQHDAEEFLGFLLDELHEETLKVFQDGKPSDSSASESGWHEVRSKQKVASTRTTTTPDSPITKIFGGLLRSEFRVSGETSVILEPYQPLQLDIQSPQISNIIDALKQLTNQEAIQFDSPRGLKVTATKQVYIETLPPVLILHLKRFQYDNKGGTQKIWKKIGYPLILDIPKEAISPLKKNTIIPKYRLIGVVYHHGKSALGGHYTVDVLRQDRKSWIRFDDTVIKRVHADEVKVDVQEKETGFSALETEEDHGWKSVTSNGVPIAINGNNNAGTMDRLYGKDGKVAYILFFQKI